MNENRNIKSTFFNFRLRPKEMEQLRRAVNELQYFSMASFIRSAIREKIERDLKNGER